MILLVISTSVITTTGKTLNYVNSWIELKGMHLNHDFYVVVGKQMRRLVTNTKSLYKLTNVLLLFISFKLVLSF